MVMLGKKSLLGLGKLGVADPITGDLPDLGNDFLLGRITLGRIGDGADIDHSLGRSERVEAAANLMDEPFPLTDFGVEDGAGARSKHRGENLDGGGVSAGGAGGTPGHIESAQIGRKGVPSLDFAQLRRLFGHRHRLEGDAGILREEGSELVPDLRGIHIADYDEAEVIRGVAALVVVEHVLPGKLVVDVEMADDRLLEGAGVEGGAEKQQRSGAVGVVVSHGKLPADHLLLLVVFLLGKRGVHHGIGKYVDCLGSSFGGNVDPVDGTVVGCIGVDVAPLILHLAGDDSGSPGSRPLEEHVLEDVGETCA